MTSLARVQNFSISLDGFGTGEGQSHDRTSVTPGIGSPMDVATAHAAER